VGTSVFAGASSGAIGGNYRRLIGVIIRNTDLISACFGNPLFLIKARMQVSDY
jgi:hypothetical protein